MESFSINVSPQLLREFLQSATPKRKFKFSPRIAKLRSIFSPGEQSPNGTPNKTPKSSISQRIGKDKQLSRTKSPRTHGSGGNKTSNTSTNTSSKPKLQIKTSNWNRPTFPISPNDNSPIYHGMSRESKGHKDQQTSQVKSSKNEFKNQLYQNAFKMKCPRIVITKPDMESNENGDIPTEEILTHSSSSRQKTSGTNRCLIDNYNNTRTSKMPSNETFINRGISRELQQCKEKENAAPMAKIQNHCEINGNNMKMEPLEQNHPIPNEMRTPSIIVTEPVCESKTQSEVPTEQIVTNSTLNYDDDLKNTNPGQETLSDEDNYWKPQIEIIDVTVTPATPQCIDRNEKEANSLNTQHFSNESKTTNLRIRISKPDKEEFIESSEILIENIMTKEAKVNEETFEETKKNVNPSEVPINIMGDETLVVEGKFEAPHQDIEVLMLKVKTHCEEEQEKKYFVSSHLVLRFFKAITEFIADVVTYPFSSRTCADSKEE